MHKKLHLLLGSAMKGVVSCDGYNLHLSKVSLASS